MIASSPPPAPPPTSEERGSGRIDVTYADGVLHVHDARGTLQVLEFGLPMSADAYQRARYLDLASGCAQWLYSTGELVGAAPDVPTHVIEHFAITLGRLAILRGDEDYLRVLAAYGGVHGLRQRDALAELLYRPPSSLLCGLDELPRPMRYLAGALERALALRDHQPPQAHTVTIEELRRDDELRHAVLTTPGIDCAEYLGALRATGRAADLCLAGDIEAWLGGRHQTEDGRYRVPAHAAPPG